MYESEQMRASTNKIKALAPVLLFLGAILAATSVILGAFGAHGLKNVLSVASLNTFEIGVRYQMYHALGVLVLPALSGYVQVVWLKRVAIAFIMGCVLFSGSLYALAITGFKWLGPITPMGGVSFIAGWGMLAFALLRSPQVKKADNDK
ncbi:DUF423 domain-containing protein [Alteromonas sp. MTD1]|uniref:DUF423 domain-containing protein n=1 Tax=Alteromonas sp. MTD1 TaxID=3057962 RepID=UPI0036F2C8A8